MPVSLLLFSAVFLFGNICYNRKNRNTWRASSGLVDEEWCMG